MHLRTNAGARELPDLVARLQGTIPFNLVGFVDSVEKGPNRGAIRNIFETVPDAPVDRFVLEMKGGDKGLLINSRSLCREKLRAKVRIVGQNGKRLTLRPRDQGRLQAQAAQETQFPLERSPISWPSAIL